MSVTRMGRLMWGSLRLGALESTLAVIAMTFGMGLGAWWTASAVVDGGPGMMIGRFLGSVAVGCYYLYLLDLSLRRRLRIVNDVDRRRSR